jgi:formylglycine-generating enzyme required for sulfatase activity/dienelactone hydrolase
MFSATPPRLRGLLSILCFAALLLAPLPIHAQTAPDERIKELEKQLAESRQLLEKQKAELDEHRRQLNAIQSYLTNAPSVEVQNENYVQARARFQTKLLRKGPPPDRGAPVKPPAGVTEVIYPSGALRLKAWVNRPADDSRKFPAVLFLHGGFEFAPGDWEQSKPYRDAGFIVMTPMLRAENGQPGAFSYFYDEVDDVLAAAEYLRQQPYVDAERLFIAGHSVGGTLTLLAALAYPHFRAAASFSGAPFWPEFAASKNLPFDKSDPREIQMRSPIAYAGSFKCPLRMFYGTGEDSFFGLMSRRAAVLAKKAGLDVEALAIEGDHGSHVGRAMPQSIAFFSKNSPPGHAMWNGEVAPLPATLELDLGGGVKMKLARIEPGKFLMGSPPNEAGRRDDEAQREMTIEKPYAIGVYTVTQGQYRRVMGMNPSQFSAKGNARDKVFGLNTDDFPVENVNWEEAMDFCRVVSLLPAVKDKGWVVDLPTEAEWEYAARAGTQTAFHYGNALSSQQANFNGNNPYGGAPKGPFLQRTTKVGSYAPNAWGLYDMHGNALQWCKDWYSKDYLQTDGLDNASRVARGGFWGLGSNGCRAARRMPVEPSIRGSGLGFRVVVRAR